MRLVPNSLVWGLRGDCNHVDLCVYVHLRVDIR